jgi:hypothetical protein
MACTFYLKREDQMIAKEEISGKSKKRSLTVFFENGELEIFMVNGTFSGNLVKILPHNKHRTQSFTINLDRDINSISSRICCRGPKMELSIGSLSAYMLNKKGETIIRNPRGNVLVVGRPRTYGEIDLLKAKIKKK